MHIRKQGFSFFGGSKCSLFGGSLLSDDDTFFSCLKNQAIHGMNGLSWTPLFYTDLSFPSYFRKMKIFLILYFGFILMPMNFVFTCMLVHLNPIPKGRGKRHCTLIYQICKSTVRSYFFSKKNTSCVSLFGTARLLILRKINLFDLISIFSLINILCAYFILCIY